MSEHRGGEGRKTAEERAEALWKWQKGDPYYRTQHAPFVEAIASAIREAEREAAEEMRERAAREISAFDMYVTNRIHLAEFIRSMKSSREGK